jgi:hypothetical protein
MYIEEEVQKGFVSEGMRDITMDALKLAKRLL